MSLLLSGLRKKARGETIEIPLAALEQMIASCDRQLTLIDSLVETRQNEIWGVSLQCQPLSLPELARDIEREWSLRLEEKQATLVNTIPADLPPVNADSHHLWRVFENLIANALKHNPAGVTIALDAGIQGDFILCTIADDGIGIDPEIAKHLFDRYYRGSGKQALGLGLGLYLCRQIITAHGGEIGARAKSEEAGVFPTDSEKGSRFWFTLPIYRGELYGATL
jgi:two-component system sensor histidine kinase/response regulator